MKEEKNDFTPEWMLIIIRELKNRRQEKKDDQEGRLPEYTDKPMV